MAKNKVVPETEDQKKYRELVETIANNIANLARAVAAMMNGPLNKRALILLLASSSHQSQNTVEQVLKALENLESDWLKK